MKKAILVLAVLAVVAAGWYIYFSSDTHLAKVNGVRAQQEDITIKIELSGEVCPEKSYSVMSALSGRIGRILVKEGDSVAQGEALLELDDSAAAMQADDSAAAFAGAQPSIDAEQTALDRAKVALALSQTTGFDYDSFNEAFSEQLKERAAQASAMLGSLSASQNGDGDVYAVQTPQPQRLPEEELTQRSLFQGKVIKINYNEGEVLPAGVPAMVIADDSALRIRCVVNEGDIKRIHKDLPIRIITRSDDCQYAGTLIGKSQAASRPQGEYTGTEAVGEIYIRPEKGFSEILGSSVDVEIILDGVQNAICLPLDSMTADGYVFVIGEGNVLEKRKAVKGLSNGYSAQMLSGVREGEMVAANPEGLEDKQKVKIVD